MSSNASIFRRINKAKAKYKATCRKRDEVAIAMAKIQNLPNFWDTTMIDWEDPRITNHAFRYLQLEEEKNALFWEIRELEAILESDLDKFEAEQIVWEFIESEPDEKIFEYLKEQGMTTHRLIEKVMADPQYIDTTYYREVEI